MVASAILDFQCVSSAFPVRYSVRYPVRYLPLLLESQYKVSDAHCVLRRSKVDNPKLLKFATPAPHIGDSIQTGSNALGNALDNALETHWTASNALGIRSEFPGLQLSLLPGNPTAATT